MMTNREYHFTRLFRLGAGHWCKVLLDGREHDSSPFFNTSDELDSWIQFYSANGYGQW